GAAARPRPARGALPRGRLPAHPRRPCGRARARRSGPPHPRPGPGRCRPGGPRPAAGGPRDHQHRRRAAPRPPAVARAGGGTPAVHRPALGLLRLPRGHRGRRLVRGDPLRLPGADDEGGVRGLHLRQVPGSEEAGVLSALTTGSPTAVIGPRRMRALLEAAPAAATTVLTAMEGQQLRGYVHLSTEEGAAWLVSGAVDPARRRRGIGTALLREAARCARAAGARSLRISGRPAGYAAPGVDPERDPGTAGFLA